MAVGALPMRRTAIILSIAMAALALLTPPSSASATGREPNPAVPRRSLLPGGPLRPRGGHPHSPGTSKEGDQCSAAGSVCPGASAGSGAEPLRCCGGRCRDVLSDRNHCGGCGGRCGFGRLCCGGACAAVAYDAGNCGGCGAKCRAGERCVYGTCGYA